MLPMGVEGEREQVACRIWYVPATACFILLRPESVVVAFLIQSTVYSRRRELRVLNNNSDSVLLLS
jgi:hypothetical protein